MLRRYIQGLRRADVRDPVMLLDELDKMGADSRGDPAAAMLEVLDPAGGVLRTTSPPTLDQRYTATGTWVFFYMSVSHNEKCPRVCMSDVQIPWR